MSLTAISETKEWGWRAGGLRLTVRLSSDEASKVFGDHAILCVVLTLAYAVLTGADAVGAFLSGGFFEHRSLTIMRVALLLFLLSTSLFGYTSVNALSELARQLERGN